MKGLMKMENKWIPVSERVPEAERLIVFTTGSDYHMGLFTKYGDWYSGTSKRYLGKDYVAAWMPLPEPYREGEEKK